MGQRFLMAVILSAVLVSAPTALATSGPRVPLSQHDAAVYANEILTRHMKKHWLNSFDQDVLSCKRHRGRYRRLCKVIFVNYNFDGFGGYIRITKKPRGQRYFYRGALLRFDGICAIGGGTVESCLEKTYRFRGSGKARG